MAGTEDRPQWSAEGRDWPNRECSRFITAGGLTWHVQEMGSGPKLLLLHGTGASTHSFRALAPALAKSFQVLLPDLPGHGFTNMPGSFGLSLPGMARLLGALIGEAGFVPDIVAGHSAGAAVLIEMALAGLIRPRLIVAINGALLPIRGASLFSPLAKLMFLNPLAPRLFAWRALSHDATRRVLKGTGSQIEDRGVELYQRLFRKPGHVEATLGMMANWDLGGLQRRIGSLAVPLVLVTAAGDRAVPPADARAVAARLAGAQIVALPYGGHLVHEEEPTRIAALLAGLYADMSPSGRTDGLSKSID